MIKKAIDERKMLSFVYHGKDRFVEPHRYGISKKNIRRNMMHAYQTEGGSNSKIIPEWGNFFIDEIRSLSLTNQTFEIERDFRPNSPKIPIGEVFASLSDPRTSTKH